MPKYLIPYFILLIVFFKYCDFSEIQNNLEDNGDKSNSCIVKIIKQIKHRYAVIKISLIDIDNLLSQALNAIQGISFVSRKYLWIKNTLYNEFYITVSNGYEEFEKGITQAKKDAFWNPKANFIIKIRNLCNEIINLSDLLVQNNMFNVTVIGKCDEEEYVIYRFNSKLDSCNRPVENLQSITSCALNTSFNFFPERKHNKLNHCHIRLISHDFWPFMTFNKSKEVLGIEQSLLNMWHESVGITIEVEDFVKSQNFGNITDNYTYTGMLSKLKTNQVDGAIGGYALTLNRHNALSFIYPYTVDHLIIVLANPKLLAKWHAVFAELSFLTIFFIALSFGVICVAVICCSIFTTHKRDATRDILIVAGYFFNNITFGFIRNGNAHRLVVLSLLFLTLIISSTLQASLLSTTTNPLRGYKVKELHEVFTKYYVTWTPGVSGYMHTLYSSSAFTEADHICEDALDCLLVVRDDKHLYTIVSEFYYRLYKWNVADDEGNLQVYSIKEPFSTVMVTMYFIKGSTVIESFDRHIQYAITFGFLKQYFDKIVFKEHLKNLFYEHDKKKPLSLNELKEVFYILLIGHCFSISIFVCECVYTRYD